MTQLQRVKAVLEGANRALALHEIGAIGFSQFRVRDAETAISARIRELRYSLMLEGKTIHAVQAKPKAYFVYSIVRATNQSNI